MDHQDETPTEFMAAGDRNPAGSSFRASEKFGRYTIEYLIGTGGGGSVYRAIDPSLRRPVAIKVLPPATATQESSRRRFVREAETASALNHPNILTIYEVGVENGVDYIAMEYIPGKSLRDSVPPRGLGLEQFFQWAIQIADALAAAHDAGVVHRDLKPGNIMITNRGLAKVVDFGLAKPLRGDDDSTSAETITRQGSVVGTCAYMAPEQAEGQNVDARADIFSFGCVMYEMLTGRAAFDGNSQLGTIASVLTKEPNPIRELKSAVPDSLERIIGKSLRKTPEARWQSAADIRTLLQYAHQDWQAPKPESPSQKRQLRWMLPAAFAAGFLIATATAYWQSRRITVADPEYRTVAVTSDSGLSIAPSLSADGRLLAYASDRSGEGNLDLWIQQIGGRAPVRLTQDPADETDPDMSPDGTRIAFRSEKDGGGVYVIPALGGESVLLAQGGRNPRFSPDGKSIAYWTGREGPSLAAGSARVYVIPADGGQPAAIGNDLAAMMYPVWSPTGDAVLAVARKNPNVMEERVPDWWVVPLSGASRNTEAVKMSRAEPRRLRVPLTQHHLLPLVWSKQDGGTVLFSARSGDAVNLWSTPLDPHNPHVTSEAKRVTSGTTADTHASFAMSSEGPRLAYASTVLQMDLWTVPVDTERAAVKGEPRRITDDLSWEIFPSLSRDAARAAYSSRRGSTWSVSLRDLASGKETTLLTAADETLSPMISGDGQWVVFIDSRGNISRVPARGGAMTEICKKCGSPTDVSPDGDTVLVEPYDTPEDVRALEVATGNVTTLVPARESLYSGKLSPDGKWVVFNERKGGSSTQLFVSRVVNNKAEPPEQWVPITNAEAQNQGPHWSPECNVIYFRSERDGSRCVWAQRLDPLTKRPNGPPAAIQHFHHSRRSLQHLRGFNDRTRIAVANGMVMVPLGELRGNIWLRDQQEPQ